MAVKVLIVGMDVATVTLALMLELAGVDYLLLEKSDSVPAVAGGMSLHPTILPLLEQLSLRDDLLFFSQPMEQVLVLDSDMEHITSYDWSDRRIRYGAWSRFMTRPEYCTVIVEKLTESRVLFDKDITSITTIDCAEERNDRAKGLLPLVMVDSRQDSMLDIDITMEKGEARGGVTVECTDGSSYTGHLLVGDIESGVEQLFDKGKATSTESGWAQGGCQEIYSVNRAATAKNPASAITTGTTHDTPAPREVQYHVSGVTEALDPQRIPLLKEDTTQLRLVMDDRSSLSWWVATLVDHRIAWQVTQRIRLSDKTTGQNADADWPLEDEEAAKASIMSQMSQSMMCPLGGTMAQIAQWTSPSEISCKRWDDRTAPTPVNPNNVPPHPRLQLLGEGQAADESILDALSLAEAIVALPPAARLTDIRDAFGRYRKERTSRREAAIRESQDLDQLLNAKGAMQKAYRAVKLNYTPKCTQERRTDEKYSYRPQANFLQPVPDYGQIQPVHQHHPSRRPYNN
ncbi:hypothetical protein EC957_007183 [Mortierella hygrophila]|uniref:FAD-binding domain-containing protein n=1 Tax=Mortierella hygrophila TaxID=979708 RepID=A0A9P6K663_9FUNG|nr:hypothetical protein EC957_007183 [Mortierella hygrophila]